MRQSLESLHRFYATPLGAAALRMVERRLGALWPDLKGLDVLGLGYAPPYLERYRAGARRVIAAFPGAESVTAWPPAARPASVLTDEDRLPFKDAIFDRVLLVHALEEAPDARHLLREVWRVMSPEGRLVAVCANRLGLWSWADGAPWGHGRPFSRRQISSLLRAGMFEPLHSARALYAWPLEWQPLIGLADGFERAGELLWPAFGGLVLMEARKRLEIGADPIVAQRARFRAAQAGAGLRQEPSSALKGSREPETHP